MITFRAHFVVDEHGKRIGVLLDMEDYRKLLEEREELDSIRAYDAAKTSTIRRFPLSKPSQKSIRISGELCRVRGDGFSIDRESSNDHDRFLNKTR